MPDSPQQPEQHARSQSVVPLADLRECIAHPTDLLEESGCKAKEDANEETIWREDRREERLQAEEDSQNPDGWDTKRRIPAGRKPESTPSGEEVPQAAFSIDDSRQGDAGKTWAEEHNREHQQAVHFG